MATSADRDKELKRLEALEKRLDKGLSKVRESIAHLKK